MSTLEVNTITPQSGTTLTLGGSGDTVTLGSGATQSGFGGVNTPSFFLNKTDTTSISNTTTTKATFNVTVFDTDSATSSSRFTVPSGEDGKYCFIASVQTADSADGAYLIVYLYVNGSVSAKGMTRSPSGADNGVNLTHIMDLSAGDYVEVYIKHNIGSSTNLRGESGEKTTFFQGFKLVE